MNKQAIQRVADRYSTGLGIIDDGLTHFEVTVLVKIGVHNSGTSLDNRYTGGVTYEVDELASTTRDAEVDVADGIQHLTCCLMGGRQQGYNIFRYTILLEYLMDQSHFLAVTAVGIFSAFQHTGITALETEREDVERHVRTRLVDHADDTEGYADTTKTKAVRQCLLFGDMAQWGRQGGDVTHIAGDTLQTTLRELQTIVEGALALRMRSC